MRLIFLLICSGVFAQADVIVEQTSLDNYLAVYLSDKIIEKDSATIIKANVVSGAYTLQLTDANDDVIVFADGADITADEDNFIEGHIIRISALNDKRTTIKIEGKQYELRYYPSGLSLVKVNGQFVISSFDGHIKGL